MASNSRLTQNWFPADQLTRKLPAIQHRKALLVIDLQNDFTSDSAALPVTSPKNFVQAIVSLIPAFRDAGSIIWIRSEFVTERLVNDIRNLGEKVITDDQVEAADAQGSESSSRSSSRPPPGAASAKVTGSNTGSNGSKHRPVSPRPADSQAGNELFLSFGVDGEDHLLCQPDTEGVKFSPQVHDVMDHDRDTFINKSHYSAFKYTSLLAHLRGNLITELYICGLLSNISVYATALDAAKHGLSTTLFEDCTGYRDKRRHDLALKKMQDYMGVTIASSLPFLKERKAAGKAVQASKDGATKPALVPNKIRMGRSKAKKKARKASINAESAKSERPGSKDSDSNESKSSGSSEKPAESKEIAGSLEYDDSTKTPDEEQIKATLQGVSRQPPKVANDAESVRTDFTALSIDDLPSPTFQVLEAVSASLKQVASHPKSSSSESSKTSKLSASKLKTAMAQTILPVHGRNVNRTHIRAHSIPSLGPGDTIAEGDSKIVYDLLPDDLVDKAFDRIKEEVKWQTMYHRGGEVPRLVAVEGIISDDGSVPIYRHPADESPPLLPFSPTVAVIRKQVQKVLNHPVNHVLIQCYRDGQDYISEHSDKTLDIVRGSSIVNVSLGAQRVMTLRTKKSGMHSNGVMSHNGDSTDGSRPMSIVDPPPRSTQRIPMPHNSMFVLGQTSNMRWLHGIRADKRPPGQKSQTEQAYDGERISLTFRHIGTYLSADNTKIWGQGARSKDSQKPGDVVNGDTYEAEQMIRAFGTENQRSEFDWDAEYGDGFDVLNITAATPKLFTSGDFVHDARVKICLAEKGLTWDAKQPLSGTSTSKAAPSSVTAIPPPLSTSTTSGLSHSHPPNSNGTTTTPPQDPIPHPSLPPVKFIDHDSPRTEVEGSLAILLYLETYCLSSPLLPSMDSRPAIAAVYSLLYAADALLHSWRHARRSLLDFAPSEAALWLVPTQVRAERLKCVGQFAGPAGLEGWEARVRKAASTANGAGGSSSSRGTSESSESKAVEGAAGMGLGFTLADVAFWPVLDAVRREWIDWRAEEWPALERYWRAMRGRTSVELVLGEKEGAVGAEV